MIQYKYTLAASLKFIIEKLSSGLKSFFPAMRIFAFSFDREFAKNEILDSNSLFEMQCVDITEEKFNKQMTNKASRYFIV